MSTRSRAYCFTLNNYSDNEKTVLQSYIEECNRQTQKIQYLVFGEEESTEGTPHLQGYVYFLNGRTIKGIKRIPGFERAHLERCSDPSAGHARAIAYCKKGMQSHEEWLESGTDGADYGLHAVVFQCGNPPQIQGARNDIERAVTLLNENGFNLEDLARREPEIYIRHYRGFEALRERLDTHVRTFKTKIIWIYGPTGVGKSRFIGDLMSEGVNVYWKVNSHKWFNGYNGQSVVALDDYRRGGGYLLFNDMLRLFDRYPLQVEFKGGACQFLSKYIIVTSSQSPTQLWDGQTDDRIDQLLRRIEHVIELPNAVSKLRLHGIRNEILRTCGLLDACNVENNENRQPLTEIEGERMINSAIRNELEL